MEGTFVRVSAEAVIGTLVKDSAAIMTVSDDLAASGFAHGALGAT